MAIAQRSGDLSNSPAGKRRLTRTRWRRWRARFSVPAMLASCDEQRVISVVTAVNGGLVIIMLGLFTWLAGLPLIFPALGPSAFILFSKPLSVAAAPRCVIMGHLIAMISGYIVWSLASLVYGAPITLAAGELPLACSASLALGLTCLLLVRLSCPHPPACASSLIVAMGGVEGPVGLLMMLLAVVWLTFQAVAANRLVNVPVPLWAPRAGVSTES
ncbi:MAG: HPP family protein [Planctomycetota bacterium]